MWSSRVAPAVLAIGVLAAMVLVPTDGAAQARVATAGNGRFVDAIDWVEWGANGASLPTTGFTGTTTRTIGPDTITTTCAVSGITSQVNPPGAVLDAYRAGTWSGDSLDELYNIGGTNSSNQLVNALSNTVHGDKVTFTFACSASNSDGGVVPLEGLVIADAEQSFGGEFVAATPSTPATWRVIDRSRNAGCTVSTDALLDGATNRLQLQGAQSGDWFCSSGPSVVGFLDGATSARAELQGGGKSAIALGVVLAVDYGDAPASYGASGHIFSPSFAGGELQPGDNPGVSNNTFTLGSAAAPSMRLGARVDPEDAQTFSSTATGDDLDTSSAFGGGNDEDGLASGRSVIGAVGSPYSARVTCGPGGGFVAGWMDWNRDGDFMDAQERSATGSCAAGAASVTWPSVPPGLVGVPAGTPTFLRLGIAADAADLAQPVGLADSGEVEDYRVTLDIRSSITVSKVVDERAHPADQFTFGVDGVGSATTTGAVTALSTGSMPVDEGASYTVRESLAAGSAGTFADYEPPVLACTSIATGAALAIGGAAPAWTLPPITRGDHYDCTITNRGFQPAIGLDMTVGPIIDQDGNGPDAGDDVNYAFLVTNTGNSPLTAVDVAQSLFSGTGPRPVGVCPPLPEPLAPGAQVRCTATYTLTQADVDAGTVSNTATAAGDAPGTLPDVTSPPVSGAVPIARNPAISVVKSASLPGGSRFAAGQVITYTFLAKNTGNTTLTGVTVADVAFSGTGPAPVPVCPGDTLAPGAQLECTADYTLTVADIDQAEVANSATATGTPPAGLPPVTSAASSVTIPTTDDASLALTKTVAPSTGVREGDTVVYTFVVQNTGNVTVSGAVIAEGSFTGTGAAPVIDCPAGAATLAPGERLTCTAPYRVTAADIGAGSIDNTASATAQAPGGPVSAPDASATLQLPANPAIALETSVDPGTASAAGDTVTYSFVITNTGDVTLYNTTAPQITFTGAAALGPLTCPAEASALSPGQSVTCTAPYTLTQADVDAGRVDSTGVATGTPAGRIPAPTSAPSSAAVTVAAVPALTLDKTASPDAATAAGTTVTYSFLLTNTGNVTLSNATVGEVAFTGAGAAPIVSCPAGAASLAPSATATCTADYELTQADIDAGGVDNTAAASATAPGSTAATVSAADTASVRVTAAGALSVVSSATLDQFVAGEVVTYSFVVTNTGSATFAGIVVGGHAFTGSGAAPVPLCPSASGLAPGQQLTCTAQYALTDADIARGSVDYAARATGVAAGGAVVASLSGAATVTVSSASPPGDGTSPGGLARTGSTGIPTGLVVALALLIVGFALVLRGRRPCGEATTRTAVVP